MWEESHWVDILKVHKEIGTRRYLGLKPGQQASRSGFSLLPVGAQSPSLAIFPRPGVVISWEKSDLEIRHQAQCLGMLVDTVPARVYY